MSKQWPRWGKKQNKTKTALSSTKSVTLCTRLLESHCFGRCAWVLEKIWDTRIFSCFHPQNYPHPSLSPGPAPPSLSLATAASQRTLVLSSHFSAKVDIPKYCLRFWQIYEFHLGCHSATCLIKFGVRFSARSKTYRSRNKGLF